MMNDKYDDYLIKIIDRLSKIETNLEHYNGSLDEHIRRTNILEDKIIPVEKHIQNIEGIAKFSKSFFWLAGGMSTILGILKVFGMI